MPLRRFSPGLKAQFAFGMVFLFVQPDASAADISAQQIGGVIIPQAFSQALQDGMSVPLYIHLAGSQGRQDDQRIGSAFIWLDDGQLRIRKIQLEESEDNASVSEQTRQQLMALANAPFNEALTIPLTDNAQLDLSLRQLLLQLVVKREALGTILRSRSEDIGQSSVNTLSSNLSYNLGVYNNQLRNGGSNTSSYLSLNNVTALREHHVVLDGSLYGIGSGQQDSELYKAMYERDFAGHRFAGGMLDTWNLQSLGPMTAISAGKIYGLSWGNQASSTIFDSSQSATPVIAFLPAAGEVHLTRDGRLLSVQNFTMGNHEVDTRGLPYGIYDVEVEVIVNGRVISKRTQRVNKLFSRGRGVGAPLAWQIWGGSFHMDRWSENGKKTRPAKESWLAGASTSGSLSTLSWAATGYGYDNQAVGETRLTLPLGGAINVNLQNMLASDSSWSSIGSISATLPGGFSSLWVNQEKTRIGNQLRRSDADNRAIGGTLNLNSLWSKLGTFSISYNDDRRYNSHYYTADYYQNVYSGTFGSLGLRAGIQRYNNGDSNANTGDAGFDDIFVYAAVPAVVEMADELLAEDGCLNFFAGPTDKNFKVPFNFYNVHYNSTHVVGTSGGSTDDMKEAIALSATGQLQPSFMVTHIGGLDAVPETVLNLPDIPGGKKLIYNGVTMPLTAIADFAEKGKTDPLFKELARLVEETHGIWNEQAEKYLLAQFGVDIGEAAQ